MTLMVRGCTGASDTNGVSTQVQVILGITAVSMTTFPKPDPLMYYIIIR